MLVGSLCFQIPEVMPVLGGGAAVCSGGAVPSLEHALCTPLERKTWAGMAVAGSTGLRETPFLTYRREYQNKRWLAPGQVSRGPVGQLPCVQVQGQSGGQRARGLLMEGSKAACPRRACQLTHWGHFADKGFLRSLRWAMILGYPVGPVPSPGSL